MKLARDSASNRPKPCASLKNAARTILPVRRSLSALVGRKQTVVIYISPPPPPETPWFAPLILALNGSARLWHVDDRAVLPPRRRLTFETISVRFEHIDLFRPFFMLSKNAVEKDPFSVLGKMTLLVLSKKSPFRSIFYDTTFSIEILSGKFTFFRTATASKNAIKKVFESDCAASRLYCRSRGIS